MSKFYTVAHSGFVYELINGLVLEHNPFGGIRQTTIEHLVLLADLKQIMVNT
jgi:hypothetical protein